MRKQDTFKTTSCVPQANIKSGFDTGFYREALIVAAPMQQGYNVALKGKGLWVFVGSARKPKEPRVFKSLDAAMSAIQGIGFQTATIEL
ncbi:plasmid replication protein RepB [Vibrio parahaemolyticus]|nr:plasmid replication protein RepB [Vibrio parahaemolyticus]